MDQFVQTVLSRKTTHPFSLAIWTHHLISLLTACMCVSLITLQNKLNVSLYRHALQTNGSNLYCPTLTKGSKWQITQIWDIDVLGWTFSCSTSRPGFVQKHWSCWKKTSWYRIDVNVNDRHISAIYEKYHFDHLLPFVKVERYYINTVAQCGLQRRYMRVFIVDPSSGNASVIYHTNIIRAQIQ